MPKNPSPISPTTMREENMNLTDRERDFLRRLDYGQSLRVADREEDRVRQRCRKAGLARYGGSPCRWAITDAGRAALAAQEQGE